MSNSELDVMKLSRPSDWASHMGDDVTFLDFVANHAQLDVVVSIAQFIWPRFIETHNCVLLPWICDEKVVCDWLAKSSGDYKAVESTLNHLHLWDVFREDDEEAQVIMVQLGRILAESWSAALRSQFPLRRFEVRFTNHEADYGPTVTMQSLQ